jgi:hypothetical protein
MTQDMTPDKPPAKSETEKTGKDENPELAKDNAVQYRAGRAKETERK